MFDVLIDCGVLIVCIILYVGIGIFCLVFVDVVDDYVMYSECFIVLEEIVEVICSVCWVVVVGMIVVCVFELVVVGGELKLVLGGIDFFIWFGYCFCVVDMLFINFYLLCLMLLMMISVFVG